MREISVNLQSLTNNYRRLCELVAPAQVMAVVKANAYGHGMHEVASALERASVAMLGVADLSEALELRLAGIRSRLMCWIVEPGENLDQAIAQDIEIGVSNFEVLEALVSAGRPRIHIKVDTGLGRNGFPIAHWDELFKKLAALSDRIVLEGIFSHLANTSEEDDLRQQREFERALELASDRGINFPLRHLAASAGAISYPQMRYELVRCGIALYGLNPWEDRDYRQLGLTPVMRASARVVNVKRVPKGQGVSYGYRYVTKQPTNLVLVPFGYAEGMPRISVGARVKIGDKHFPVVGRVAMDQFIVDVGDETVHIGDEVVIFGDSALGEPSAEELGASAQTINYEVVTRIGGRAKRVYLPEK